MKDVPFKSLQWHAAIWHEDCTLDLAERAVLATLVRHGDNETGICWPGSALLQRESAVQRSKLKLALAELESRCLFERSEPGGTFEGDTRPKEERLTCVYTLPLLPPVAALHTTRVTTRPGSPHDPGHHYQDGHHMTPTRVTTRPGGGSPRGPKLLHGTAHGTTTQNHPPPKDLTGRRARDAGLEGEEDLGNSSVQERAQRIVDDATMAAKLKPHRWDEVIQLAKTFAEATGQERGVGAYEADSGTAALVTLLAVFDYQRLLELIPLTVQQDFWREQPARPLAHLKPTVVENAINAAAKAEAATELIEVAQASLRKAATQIRAVSSSR